MVLEKMRERNCPEKIKKYKEEIKQMRVQSGLSYNTISHSYLNQQRREMINNLSVNNFLEVKHRLLNTYVHNYKEKLGLTN